MNDIGTICAGCGKPRVEGNAAEHRPCLRRNLETVWSHVPPASVQRCRCAPLSPWRVGYICRLSAGHDGACDFRWDEAMAARLNSKP